MQRWLSSLLFPCFLFAQSDIERESMLYQAQAISQKFSLEIAKLPPPPLSPQPQSSLNTASIWFSIDLDALQNPAFGALNEEGFWDRLREIGIQGVYLKGLKKGGQSRTGIGLDPKWGSDWNEIALQLQKKNIALIGDSLSSSTGLSPDFWLALKNYGPYPGLYHLVEIEQRDWKMLPNVGNSQLSANVPWLTLQELHKKGYVPEQFAPYVKESNWNTTGKVKCIDGKVRRWIYLKENGADPVIDWLNPSFAGSQIAAADTLDSIYNLGQKIVRFNDSITPSAIETQALWARKLGNYSVLETKKGIEEWKKAPTDLITDTLTQSALLHALVCEDAEALKLIYRVFLEEGIDTKRLVHSLQPFDEFSCDWKMLLAQPKKRFKYYEETLTGEMLRIRLLKEDADRLEGAPATTWPSYCMAALGVKDIEKKRDEIVKAHLLLAFFYAMQPGTFSLSLSDLLGMLSQQKIELLTPNEQSLYGSLSSQMKNSCSFANQLKNILSIRTNNGIDSAELIAVPKTAQKGLLLLLYRHRSSSMLQLLALNFGKTPVQQTLEIPSIRQTTAIDLITGLAEKKPLDSATLRLELPPLSGKALLFQTKYYD